MPKKTPKKKKKEAKASVKTKPSKRKYPAIDNEATAQFRITTGGETIAYRVTKEQAIAYAKKAAKDVGATAYIEEWRPTMSFDKKGKRSDQ